MEDIGLDRVADLVEGSAGLAAVQPAAVVAEGVGSSVLSKLRTAKHGTMHCLS